MKLALLLLGLWLAPAHAFPTKPVRVIVAFTPGGVTDIIARTLMPKLADLWGQPVVIENRPGAGGSVGAQVVARAPADGSVLLVHSSGYAINAARQQIHTAPALARSGSSGLAAFGWVSSVVGLALALGGPPLY